MIQPDKGQLVVSVEDMGGQSQEIGGRVANNIHKGSWSTPAVLLLAEARLLLRIGPRRALISGESRL